MSTIYKIMRIEDGLFSTGGMSPSFTKHGKTWTSYRNLRLHLAQFAQPYSNPNYIRRYKDCVVVEFEYVERATFPVGDVIDDLKEKRDQREREYQESLEKYRKQQRWERYQSLKKEFEDLEGEFDHLDEDYKP